MKINKQDSQIILPILSKPPHFFSTALRQGSLCGLLVVCLFSVTLGGVSSGLAQTPSPTPEPSSFVPEGYQLEWHDEFDGTSLDENKWQYRTDKKMGSEQRAENVSVSDGNLILGLTYTPDENAPGRPYSGSGVISMPTFDHGYYEARFKVPKAQGWHTSFWMMGYNGIDTDPKGLVQEIDVCENESFNPKSFGANLHKWNAPKKHFGSVGPKGPMPDLSEDFHVWGCEFTPEIVNIYFEGRLVASYDATLLGTTDPQNIWLTSVCSKHTTSDHGPMNPDAHPASAEFDYVRYYTKP